ncbi:hypothetical protein [Vibrio phage YC]|uniref:Uncharacterized protein n=1 Tax=Vibrio phage YC TaxID=2267403 RepID=A0A384ZS53_9CAUD|nr:DNA binding protein [Vibrio phage YC]AXC34469.1 hypothetical protein [Vibrio phage YC]
MNIFYLDECPIKAAKMSVVKHLVKMPSECVQLLSATLRLVDGQDVTAYDPDGTKHTLNMLDGETYKFVRRYRLTYRLRGVLREKTVKVDLDDQPAFPRGAEPVSTVFKDYKMVYDHQLAMAMTHENHPSRQWVGMSFTHYDWLMAHCYALEIEWRHHYGHPANKRHASVELLDRMPMPSEVNFPDNGWVCDPLIAIKDERFHLDTVRDSYRAYYTGEKMAMGVRDYFLDVMRDESPEILEKFLN